MFADIEIAHDIDQNYDINDKLADSSGEEIFRRDSVSGFIPCQSHTDWQVHSLKFKPLHLGDYSITY